ncbi:MAG: WYL domain-containing protein [Actinobacteria bacterium]|nr:WYL domain-containing protein [Actinomycetota bacterium]
MTIATQPPATLRPFGLVLKAGSWQLVHLGDDLVEVRALDDLRATRITRRRFARPPDFDLATFWTAWTTLVLLHNRDTTASRR